MKIQADGNKNIANKNNENLNILEISQTAYAGLSVSEFNSETSYEATAETIVIAKWVKPEWSDNPLVKIDYPQMGFVEYSRGQSP